MDGPAEYRWPCAQCGADLRYAPGQTELTCDHCGHVQAIAPTSDRRRRRAMGELDLGRGLADDLAVDETQEVRSLACPNCGARIEFQGASHATECPFCATPVVTDTGVARHIKPQALVPFTLTEDQARNALIRWMGSLWFAPNALLEYARKGRAMNGIYVPFWTFDADTRSRYTGQRGDYYYETEMVTVTENGRSRREQRQVRKTRWTSVSGQVARGFDDVLIMASTSLPQRLGEDLTPWDMGALEAYNPDFLAGFQAEGYTVSLAEGNAAARERMSRIIEGDVRRNIGYRKALHATLAAAPSQLALDIGAGFGLLSMFAAQAGAARVIGCEQHPIIAGIGREVVAANGWSDRISLIAKECRALTVPDDLPARADLAIFELFDCSLIGEGVLHFLAYAREHLLAADARYLPAGARLRAMAVEYRIDRILDVDATLLNPYRASPNFINVDARTLDYRALSAPFDLFDFDFATAGPAAQELAIDVPAIADGSVGAILFWFDLRLDADTVLSNAPDGGDGLHWKQGLQFLPEARVAAGQTLPLVAHHNGSGLRLQWQPDGLPAEAFSRMPRFDPRWLAASSELEQQTRNLLQHCAQNPDEFAQVAQIAQRMAIDPARYDLDPVIAQRFMSMFFAN